MSATRAPLAWIESRPRKPGLVRFDVREIWAYREVARALALRDLKLRYKQTAFGVAWAVLQPLGAALVFTLVFDRVVGVPSDGIDYPVFVFTGLVVWLYFSGALEAAALSLADSRELVTKVYFPRVLAPLASVLPGLVDLTLSLGMVAIFMVVYEVTPSAAVISLQVWMLAATCVAFTVGVWLAALNVLYRDVRYTLTFMLQIWLFASPVVFPSSLIDGTWQYVFYLNPMAGVIDGFRWSVLDGPAPPPEALISLLSTIVIAITGIAYFQHVERSLADRI